MATTTHSKDVLETKTRDEVKVTTGPAAAAFISGGIGILVLGLMTTGAVISEGLSTFLNWRDPVGPLSGKTGMAIIVWLISWVAMHTIWKDKEYDLNKAFTIMLILIGVGLLLTFPPIFEAFE